MSCHSISVHLLREILGINDLGLAIETLMNQVRKNIRSVESHHVDIFEPSSNLSEFLDSLNPTARQAFAQNKIVSENIDSYHGSSGTPKKRISLPMLSTKNNILGVASLEFSSPQTLSNEQITYLETITLMIAMSVERHQSQLDTKRILKELQKSQERLGLALQSQKMGVWDWDIVNNKLYWDDTMLEIFGVEKKDFGGSIEDWEKAVVPEDLESIIKIVQAVLTNKMDYDHDFRIYRHGEIRNISAIGSVIRDEFGNAVRFTGLNWDITEKVLAKKKLEQERAKAISNSKMASLGEMASGIAHEINNPLTIILNRTSQLKTLVQADTMNRPIILKEIEKIEATFQRIVKIIRGLKAFSRNADNDPMISCDLNSVIDETMELCLERFKTTGIDIKILGLDHLYTLSCRPAQISQVLLNLLNNSFDAICKTANPWIEIRVSLKNEIRGTSIQIRVIDSGKGIPHGIAEKMMDPFFTTKDVGQGTGLGLPISKGIVEEHHGKLWLEKESEHTTFVIELPLEEIAPKNKDKFFTGQTQRNG